MSASGRRIDVTDAPTRLNSLPADSVSGASIDVKNPTASGNAIDIGGSTVAAGAGYEIAPGSSKAFHLDAGEDLYAVAPAGQSVTVQVLEVGV